MKEDLASDAYRTAELISSSVNYTAHMTEIMAKHMSYMELLSGKSMIHPELSVQDLKNRATQILNRDFMKDGYHEDLFLADQNGTILIDSDTANVNTNIAKTDYFPVVMTGVPYISKAMDSDKTKHKVVVFAYPVMDENQTVIGVFGNTIEMPYFSKFTNDLVNAEFLEKGNLYITDNKGSILVSKGVRKSRLEDAELLKISTSSEDSVEEKITYGNIKKNDSYIYYSILPISNWTVFCEESVTDVQAPLREFIGRIALITLFFILLSAILGVRYVRKNITNPIHDLRMLFKGVANGNFKVYAKAEEYQAEFKGLAADFNQMVDNGRGLVEHIEKSVELIHECMTKLSEAAIVGNETIVNVVQRSAEVAASVEIQASENESIATHISELGELITEINDKSQVIKMRSDENLEIYNQSRDLVYDFRKYRVRKSKELEKMTADKTEISAIIQSIQQREVVMDTYVTQLNLLSISLGIEASKNPDTFSSIIKIADEIRNNAEQTMMVMKEIVAFNLIRTGFYQNWVESVKEMQIITHEESEKADESFSLFDSLLLRVIEIHDLINEVASGISNIELEKEDVVKSAINVSTTSEMISDSVQCFHQNFKTQSDSMANAIDMVDKLKELVQQLDQHSKKFIV